MTTSALQGEKIDSGIPSPRLLAIMALLEISGKGSRPKNAIDTLARSLDRRDRAFMMELVYGVLRFRDTLDWILKQFLRNFSGSGEFTINNLRTALFQIYFMRVPDWAVVNESVEIEKKGGVSAIRRRTGRPTVVNGVLRNILRRKNDFTPPLEFDDPVAAISVNTSHPQWMVKRWMKRFGGHEAALLAEANNQIPPMTIRVNSLRITRNQLISKLRENGFLSRPANFSPDGIIMKELHSYSDLSFVSGLFAVQDEASQLIAYLLDPKPGERILDACAAPGGKTTHIAQLMRDSGEVIAVEKDPERIGRLEENIKNSGIRSIKIINADFSRLENIGTFDRILLDAPCSSLGVIRRNPDVKYRRRAGDLAGYRSKQIKLLLAASSMLRENGILVYSVCSTEPEEGEEVVSEFLKTAKEMSIINADSFYPGDFADKGFYRTYPHKHNMDGFFGVKFCRKK
ncbi:MAG: 16S rRNA (cytosine(967)-C(5))-methyltransferase RsmB [Nitrospirota bacterium]|nr:16S rRNA (cytosine(967)-C(5))-methyltransferase RsmB [Nitrospirota bacterium]